MIKPLLTESDKIDAEFEICKEPVFSLVQIKFPNGCFVVLTKEEWTKQNEKECVKCGYKVSYLS